MSVRTRQNAMKQILGLFPPGRVVDLGTGHGAFACLAADLGWEVTAVDARTERWPDDRRVRWIKGDIRDVDVEDYDVILCLGLFYHLTVQDQLQFLERAAARPTVIDTHLDHGTHDAKHKLSEPVTTPEGYTGRFYSEGDGLKSSWGNSSSFWPTLGSFHAMLDAAGFGTILAFDPWLLEDRTIFLALPALR